MLPQRFDITPFTYHLCCPDCGGDWTICGHATPDAVLELAELTAGVKEMAEERAAHGEWPAPMTVADYLAWIEDEATIQEEQAADHSQERGDRIADALALQAVACHLRCLGVRPSRLPWKVPPTSN